MKTCLRIATLIIAAAGGLAAAPTQATDATLNEDRNVVRPAGAERWRLRSTEVAVTGSTARRPARSVPLSALPEERRMVRIIYPDYQQR